MVLAYNKRPFAAPDAEQMLCKAHITSQKTKGTRGRSVAREYYPHCYPMPFLDMIPPSMVTLFQLSADALQTCTMEGTFVKLDDAFKFIN